MIIGKLALEHLAVERRVSVDDRLLAAICFHRLEHDLDLGDGGFAPDALWARLGVAVPLHVEYRRKSVVVFRHVQYEPQRLLLRGPAPIHEMIGAAGDAGLLRRAPIVDKFRVDSVTPFGRLDVSEMDPRIADFLPV